MNVKTVKKPNRRVDIGYVSRFKMQAYGYDNLYPQNLARITEASGTAMLCLNRYARFIEGYGFDSDILAALAMNQQGDTADDLLRNVAQDLARFGGFALHVNYNVLGQVSSVSHVPLRIADWKRRTTRGTWRTSCCIQTGSRRKRGTESG